jgi:hypothetical protein
MSDTEIDKSIPVEFLNPRRKARSWCVGYLQRGQKKRSGIRYVPIFFDASPSYIVWVKDFNVLKL